VLVRIKAAGLNRADCSQRRGNYPPPAGASTVLGIEVAGVIEEIGKEVVGWKVGDRVMALLSGGGYAQYCTIHEDMLIKVPDDMPFEIAAGIPEAYMTAYQAIYDLGHFSENQSILIHAGASGVGCAAIQLVKQHHPDNKVIVTAGSAEKTEFCRKLGADLALNYKEQNWKDEIQNYTNGKGVDILLDFVGAPYWNDNIASLGMDGVMVFLGSLGGTQVSQPFDMGPILRKRLQIKGSTLRSRSLEYKQKLTQELSQFLLPRLQDGRLTGVVDKVFDWKEVASAHQYMSDNKNTGKIVLNNINLD